MLQRKKLPCGRQAFTLIEVMMAAVILALVIVGMIQAVISGSEMLDFSRKQTIAMQILRAEIDALSQTSWTTVTGYPSSATTTDLKDLSSASSVGYPELVTLKSVAQGFSVARKVDSVYMLAVTPPAPQSPYSTYYTYNVTGSVYKPDMRKVTFTVTWTGNTGHVYSRSSATYFGKNGANVTFQRS